MRPSEYQDRKKIRPGQIKCTSRYVMNRLYSHRRVPVKTPLSQVPVDDPETRGLTKDENED